MAKDKKNQTKKKRVWRKTVIIVCGFLAVSIIIGLLFIHAKMSKIKKYIPEATIAPQYETFETDDQEPGADLEVVDPADITWPADTVKFFNPDIINVLLIGQDRRSGQSNQRSDSMIIFSYNKADKTIKLISLMRDMYVQIPGYSDNRINAAFQFGGMELLDKTIEKDFGVSVNGNIEVDFEGFISIVDEIGGIDIKISDYDANHLNKKHGWNLVEGMNHLDGKKALAYARIRYVGNADYERTDRQRRVLEIIINEIMSLSLPEQLKMFDTILPYMTTDMSKQEILGCCYFVLQSGIDGVERYRIPADGAYYSASIRGMSVLVPDLQKNQELLMQYIME
jgi:LCP family protein required for cell wall assembly